MLSSPFARKSLERLRQEAAATDGFKRTLSTWDLSVLGVGLVIGTGIFVLTGHVAAVNAGPAVALSFLLAAIPAALAAFCYAEMVSTVPASGGAYTYVSVALGELPGFLIGWSLVLAYLVGASTVATGWAAYVATLVRQLGGVGLPEVLLHAPIAAEAGTQALRLSGAWLNLPAALILLVLAGVATLGARESMHFTMKLVFVKVAVVALFVLTAARYVRVHNWLPFVPANEGVFGHFGWSGVLQGASVAVFAYLGVDNLSTAVQEARDPHRSVPRAIGITMGACTALYIIVCMVLTGVVPYRELGVADPIAAGIAATRTPWLEIAVQAGTVAGLTSVLMMQLYGLPRILYAMAGDGLAPAWARQLSSKRATPVASTLVMGGLAAFGTAFLPIEVLGELTSVCTLLAFTAVSLGVAVLRRSHPRVRRRFRVPGGPYLLPGASAVGSLFLLAMAPGRVLLIVLCWLVLGAVLYAVQRQRHAAR